MPIRNNTTLGHTVCSECAEVATVHQQSRGAGRFLYSRGCDCKFRNSTGKVFQTRLWRETEWLPGVDPVIPPNVEDPGEVAADLAPPQSEPVIDPDSSTASSDCGLEAEEREEEDESISGWLVAGLSLLAGVAVFFLSGGRRLP